MVGFATQLPPLCARPPTPPKESTTKLLNENSLGLGLASHIDLNTPDESPSSSAEYFKGSSEKAQKKVGFTGWTQFHRLSVSDNDYDSDGQLRQLPPSRDCKSLKSILKVRNDTAIDPSINNLLGFDNTNVPAMLRSTVQHLASPSRSSRLDAYINLLACLSAYDDIPDAPDLAEKVTEITGYIRQDVFAKTGEDGALDIQLATQALKLLTVFLCTPSMAMMLPEELCSFILERSIASIEDEGSPKILVSHYMLLLEKQKFSTKYMTIDRVNRLLSALDVVTTRIKGNRVVGHRLMIYQRLLGQAKPLMISRIGSWIDHLISGMLSTIKDIRARSIAFGMQAALQLGTISSVSQLCIEVFNRESADGRKVVDFLCSRLIDLTGSKEDGVQVPQVWSVVILFLRGRRRQLECWEHLKAWLVVVQRCFNSSEAHIKFQANIAWNQLIFAISPDTSTSNSMAKMLRQPIVSQLERKGSDKNSKQAKQIARSSYCILLYYAFRPSATHAQLDQYWDLYVSQILPNCFVNNQMDINHACDILTALFSGNGRPKIRDESKVNMNGPLKAEDLPCLDPKWVRLRAGKILQVFDRFFDVADWQLGREPEAPIVLAWRGFATALGNAGSKEVKVSMDSLSAVAHIINEIKRLLERSNLQTSNERNGQIGKLSSQPEQSDMYEKITVIIREAVARIGNIPFMERRMLLTSQDSFEPADTPSSRTNRDPSSLNSPAAHLLSLLLRNIRDGHITTSHTGAIRAVMHISMQPGGPRRSQLGVIRNLARMLSVHSTLHKGAGTLFWNLLAEATTSALQLSQSNETHNGSPHYSGHEYRDAIKILELGAQQQISHITPNWISLQQCIADTLRQEIGDESISLMMTEPLAAVLNKGDNQCDGFLLSAAGSLIKNAHWPQSSHVLEIMQQRLWGVVQIAHKANLLNLYDKLYSMVNSLLGSSYVCLKSLSTETIMEFMSAVQDLIASCPQNAIGLVLNRIQRGLAYWVEDAGEVLSSSVASATKNLALKVHQLWTTVVKAIHRIGHFNIRTLVNVQGFVAASFRSHHKKLLNEAITMWNATFGLAESLEYSEDLRLILRKLRSLTELQLPTFPDSEGDGAVSSPLHLMESEDEDHEEDEEMQLLPPKLSHQRASSDAPSPRTAKPLFGRITSPRQDNLVAHLHVPSTARRGANTTPKARLRHDDSQIQFAAIDSSPLQPEPVESQYLTDRQKEVKERQGLEVAAMFPEIRSSPKSAPRPAEYSLPKLVFKPTQDQAVNPSVDDDTSPTFSLDISMNEFLGSSPTPRSRKRGQHSDDDEPPSSPPFVSSVLPISQNIDPPYASNDYEQVISRGQKDQTNCLAEVHAPNPKDVFYDKDQRAVAAPLVDFDEVALSATPQSHTNAHAMSDSEVFVDAPSEPVGTKDCIESSGREANVAANSFQSEGSSHFSTEDDQVTAQLVSEMERASSQQPHKPESSTPLFTKATSKRKRKGSDGVAPIANKKQKHTLASSDLHEATNAPSSGSMVAACVMINVRKAERSLAIIPHQIKSERCASPSFFASTQAVEETPVAPKGPIGRTKSLRSDQSSSQGEGTPASGKKAVGRPRGSRQSQGRLEQEVNVAPATSSQQRHTRKSGRLNGEPMSSPRTSHTPSQENSRAEPWISLGKTPRRGMFRWRQSSDEDSESGERRPDSAVSSPHVEDVERTIKDNDQAKMVDSAQSPLRSLPGAQTSQHVSYSAASTNLNAEISQSEVTNDAEKQSERPNVEGILQGFKDMLDHIKRGTLGREEEREMVGVLFELVREVHEAGRRHSSLYQQ